MRRVFAPWIALLGLAACADLHTLPRDQCGNGIIEAGEDCDGAPIEGHACNAACRLPCGAESTCPPAWGCGNDGLCRQPSDAFTPFGAALGLAADSLTLADFDADGRSDVLAVRGSTFTVAYLDPGGLQSKTTTVSLTASDAHRNTPAVGDMNGDGRADLAFRLREGVAVMRGGADRSLIPAAFAGSLEAAVGEGDVLIAADVDLRPEAPGEEIFAVRDDGLHVVHTGHPDGAKAGALIPLPAHGALVGTPPTGYLTNTGTTAGIDVVLAFEGDDHVTLVKPLLQTIDPATATTTWSWNDGTKVPPRVIALPAGATVRGGVFLAGAQVSPPTGSSPGDLIIAGVDAQGQPQVYVAFWTNYQGFSSTPPTIASTPDDKAALILRSAAYGGALDPGSPLLDTPLAVVDLNGDRIADFVTPRGVFVSTCSNLAPYCRTTTGTQGPLQYALVAQPEGAASWTEALAPGASRNLGIAGDVYLASSDAGLTYLRGAYGALGLLSAFDIFHIPTQSPIRHFASGDFDGDGAPDLAFSQASARDPGVDSLHVSFGSPLAIPTAPVDLGDLGAPGRLVSARLGRAAGINDAVSDLLVTGESGGSPALFRFDGSTDRQIQSPLLLTSPCDPTAAGAARLGTPRGTAIGRFGAEGDQHLAAIYEAADGTYALWSLAPESSDTAGICAGKTGPGAVEDPGGRDLAMLPVDLDGDGVDELVILPLGGSRLHVAHFTSAGITVESLDLSGPHAGLAAADLGARAEGAKAGRDVILWSDGGVSVLWNDGSAKLAQAGAASTGADVNTATCDGEEVGAPRGVAAINLDGDAERELVVLTGTHAVTLDLDHAALQKGTRTFAAPRCRRDLRGGGAAVTSGDANGDGVPDLVIAGSSGIQVYAGKPVTE